VQRLAQVIETRSAARSGESEIAFMDCVIHVVLRVMMRRSFCRLQEVVGMATDIATALFVAVRVSGLVSRRPPSSISAGSSTTYYYSPAAAASLIGMSRIDRH
jgi:Ca2+/Na+ antiporter